MTISEKQLEIWSKQGSTTQSQATYNVVKNCLEQSDAAYSKRNYRIFLQGSYGNDTNIYADSDVDVVISTDSIYYFEDNNLSDDDKLAFHRSTIAGDGYNYSQFKGEVFAQLVKTFGNSVKIGKKAIFIPANGTRRDTDVLPAIEHRRYTRYKNENDNNFDRGICFWTSDGVKIINYPKQHSENCTLKHQRTRSWFKPCVRILKNMRNAMVEKGYLADGVAPSYFLEGMLYNVPDTLFGHSFENSISQSINWVINSEREKLLCANEVYYLVHPTSPVTWRAEKLQTYLNAATKFWNVGNL